MTPVSTRLRQTSFINRSILSSSVCHSSFFRLKQSPEYTLPGVLHFLQAEWRRYEKDRNEWEIERAEMKARIALLEGERRGNENMKNDLMRRVKMLEYALRQERSKYLSAVTPVSNAQSIKAESPASEEAFNSFTVSENEQLGVKASSTSGLSSLINMGSLPYRNLSTAARDPKHRGKSRELLKACMQEIDYLTNAATNIGANGIRPTSSSVPDGANRKHNRSNTPSTAISEDNDKIDAKSSDEEQSLPMSPNYEQRNSFTSITNNTSYEHRDNGVNKSAPTISSNGKPDEEFDENKTTVIHNPKSSENWKGRSGNKFTSGKNAEDIKEEEDQLTKDVQKKFNISEGNVTKLMKLASNSGSDPQLDGLEKFDFNLEDDTDTQRPESDQLQQNGSEHKMWRQRFTCRSHLDTVRSISWHQSELLLVSGSEDGTIKLWDLKNIISNKSPPMQDIEASITYRGHLGAVNAVVMESEQRRCYSASMDATIRVWSLPSPKREIYAPVDPSLNLNTYIGHTDVIWDIKLFPIRNRNTRLLASASADGTVKIWDTETDGSPLKTSWNYYGTDNSEKMNGDGRPPIPTSIDFVHTDLTKVAVAYQNSIIKLFDIETGQCILDFKSDETYDNTPATQINRIVAHPTLSLLFSAHEDQYMRFFDVKTGQCTYSTLAHMDAVTSLDVDPSGMILISGGHDSSIRLWDIFNSRTCIQEFVSHRRKSDEGVLSVQYHPNMPWLASGGADSVVKIYS
ncbi:77_t:CDS:10 [Ambispora leptoticha]|uniref:77_t:CDS:1 n=1 Tax=Ambispora leptoticha TaxID=144679 RepID=A0A9N9ATT4_9GLOM|nr:77_t:CDS:10 [Ambispora leptoticha]